MKISRLKFGGGVGVKNSFFQLIKYIVDKDWIYDGMYNDSNNNNTMTRMSYIHDIIWPTNGLEKRWRDTNTWRVLTYYTSTRCGDALYADTHIPPAAHEFENRITQTPCRRLYISVLLLFIHNKIYNCSSGITPRQFNICVQCNVYLYTYNAVGRYLMYSIYKTR